MTKTAAVTATIMLWGVMVAHADLSPERQEAKRAICIEVMGLDVHRERAHWYSILGEERTAIERLEARAKTETEQEIVLRLWRLHWEKVKSALEARRKEQQ